MVDSLLGTRRRYKVHLNKKTPLFFHCRGENRLEEDKDVVYLHVAVRSHLGSVPHPGLGAVRARTLRCVLLTRLGADETRGLLVCHRHVHLQPRRAFCHHHRLLLWHRLQALLHLQKGREQQARP